MIKKENYNIPGAKGRGMLMDITYDTRHKDAPVVIFAHGFKGFKDWGTHNLVANYFAEHGFRYLKFNFSHNGTTADKPIDFVDLIDQLNPLLIKNLDSIKRIHSFESHR